MYGKITLVIDHVHRTEISEANIPAAQNISLFYFFLIVEQNVNKC